MWAQEPDVRPLNKVYMSPSRATKNQSKTEDSRASPNVLLLWNHPAPAETFVADELGAILHPLLLTKLDTLSSRRGTSATPLIRSSHSSVCPVSGALPLPLLRVRAPRVRLASGAYVCGSSSGTLPRSAMGTSRNSPGVKVAVVLANEMSVAREYENRSSSSEFHSLSDGVGSMYSPCWAIRCRSACRSFRRRVRSAGACRRGSSIIWCATVGYCMNKERLSLDVRYPE